MRRGARGCPGSNTRAASVPARRLPVAGATGWPPPSDATIWPASHRRASPPRCFPAQQGGTSWIATPVHLSAGLSQVHLDHRGLLHLGEAQRAALAASFATEFGASGLTLAPLESGEFLLHGAGLDAVPTTEPARCAGGEVAAALPHGPAAAAAAPPGRGDRDVAAPAARSTPRAPTAVNPPSTRCGCGARAGREGCLRRGGSARRSGAPSARTPTCAVCGIFTGGACQALPAGLWRAGAARRRRAVLALAVADELRMSMASTFLQALRAARRALHRPGAHAAASRAISTRHAHRQRPRASACTAGARSRSGGAPRAGLGSFT